MTIEVPLDKQLVESKINSLRIADIGAASIREIVAIVNLIEKDIDFKFVRMEMGVPGLPPSQVGVDAEIKALENGVASIYPMVDGIELLKEETSKFVKNFLDIEVNAQSCVPTVGSMQGTYVAFMAVGNIDTKKDTTLFIDPGFPVQKQQIMVLGQKYETFDVFNYRGNKLKAKLESYLSKGNINAIVYSNPNNPSWICFTDEELKVIGELANQYDVIILEDLAYFGMDFRQNSYHPGKPPYQPTVAKYTDNYILFISSSKIFSYAGQRCGMMIISDKLYARDYEQLQKRFQGTSFGAIITLRLLYSISSGTAHSAQHALAAMLQKANEGSYNFLTEVKAYGERAAKMKEIFTKNGFDIVYKEDMGKPIADGFYFTISYPNMTGVELVKNLLFYGVSSISLGNTGSNREGIRACVSFINPKQFKDLEERITRFHHDFQ